MCLKYVTFVTNETNLYPVLFDIRDEDERSRNDGWECI